MSQQGLLQQAIRGASGTALEFNGDWLGLMAADSIATGSFNERLLAWINTTLGADYTSLPAAQQAYAVGKNYVNWSSMGLVTFGTDRRVRDRSGSIILNRAGEEINTR